MPAVEAIRPLEVSPPGNAELKITIVGAGSVYFGENQNVSASNKLGELATGETLTIQTKSVWLIAVSASTIVSFEELRGGGEVTTKTIEKYLPSSVGNGSAAGLTALQPDATGHLPEAKLPPTTLAKTPFIKGANVVAYTATGLISAGMKANLEKAKEQGLERIVIVQTWSIATPTANVVAPTTEGEVISPTDTSIRECAAFAKSLGLGVGIKLDTDIVTPHGTGGSVNPSNVTTFFASYTEYVEHYATIAQELGCELFVIGTELEKLSLETAKWKTLIAVARTIFTGSMTYAANRLGDALQIKFWPALDFIGVDLYQVLTEPEGTANPGAEALEALWRSRGFLDEIERLYRLWDVPIIATEMGYQSRIDCASNPGGGTSGEINEQAQAEAYEAAYNALGRLQHFQGIYWWAIDTTTSENAGSWAFVNNKVTVVVNKLWLKARAMLGRRPDIPLAAAFRVYNTAGPSLANNTLITVGVNNSTGKFWNTVELDTDHGFVSTEGSQAYVVKTPGLWVFQLAWQWAAATGGALRLIRIMLNGESTLLGEDKPPFKEATGSIRQRIVTPPTFCKVGDSVQVQVQQDSGGTLGVAPLAKAYPVFSGYRIGA
jgi:hypothetical protein